MRIPPPKSLSNYGAGLLRFTRFCDNLQIPEETRMPAPEWLLSSFISTRGAGTVSKGTMASWLAGLQLWHEINYAPWSGRSHLKRVLQGAAAATPSTSRKPKRLPVTIAHLLALRSNLSLSNTFDAAVFATACVAFWCQCRLAEVCVDNTFDPRLHPTRNALRRLGQTASGIRYGSFWAPVTKTSPCGQEILWTDSACPTSANWAMKNHLKVND